MRTTATFLTLLSFILSSATTAWGGLPPTTIQGQSDASAKPKFAFQVPNNQFTDLGGIKALVETGNKNFLPNASFENSSYSTSWTITTASGAVEASTVYSGKQSAKITFSSSTGDIAQSVTPTANIVSTNMEASCAVNTTMTTIQVCAISAGTETNCQNAPSNGVWNTVTSNFVGPANGSSVGVRVKTSSSGSGFFYADDCYVGPARNLGLGALGTDFISYTPTLGAGYGTATNNVAYYRRVGDGMEVYGSFTTGTVAGASSSIGLPGTFTIDANKVSIANTTSNPGQDVGRLRGQAANNLMTLVTATGTSTSNVYMSGLETNGTSLTPVNANATLSSSTFATYHFTVPITGWTSNGAAFRPDQTPASWSGYMNASSGWTQTSTTLSDFAAGSGVTLTERQNRNFGTVTAAAGSLPGFIMNFPRVGRYNICAGTAHTVTVAGGVTGLQITDGTTVVAAQAISSAATGQALGDTICGIYNASAAGTQTIKLQSRTASGTLQLYTGVGPTFGNTIEWSVIELDAPMTAPYLTGSLTSNASVGYHVEYARFTMSGGGVTCTLNSQSGSWISSAAGAVAGGAGYCQLNITSGEFSSAPICTVTPEVTGGGGRLGLAPTTSAVLAGSTSNNSTGTIDATSDLICMGPR